MKALPPYLPAFVVIGFLWAATTACAGSAQGQTPTKPDTTSPPQSKVQAGQNAPKKKSAKSGVWHHFGEDGAVPDVGTRVSGPWQSLGSNRMVESAPGPSYSSNRITELERQMWALVNRDRLNPANSAETKGGHGLPLRWNEKVAEVARAHSRDMLEQRFFGHVDLEGSSPAERISAAGIPWQALGENIAINGTVAGGEDAFMNEPRFQENHRANVLNAKYTDVGIGIVQAPNGSYYITQDFIATPTRPHTSGNGLGAVNQTR
jgi:uncharacterized protein YkwD